MFIRKLLDAVNLFVMLLRYRKPVKIDIDWNQSDIIVVNDYLMTRIIILKT